MSDKSYFEISRLLYLFGSGLFLIVFFIFLKLGPIHMTLLDSMNVKAPVFIENFSKLFVMANDFQFITFSLLLVWGYLTFKLSNLFRVDNLKILKFKSFLLELLLIRILFFIATIPFIIVQMGNSIAVLGAF
jgi:hypothetical protein